MRMRQDRAGFQKRADHVKPALGAANGCRAAAYSLMPEVRVKSFLEPALYCDAQRNPLRREPRVMMFLQNLSIRAKVIIAFTLVLVLTGGLGYFAADRLGAVNNAAHDIRTNWLPSVRAL